MIDALFSLVEGLFIFIGLLTALALIGYAVGYCLVRGFLAALDDWKRRRP